jgi:hypothetical protein
MLELGPAEEKEVVLAFLKAEVEATRYGPTVQHLLARSGFTRRQLIDNADLADMTQNHARSSILQNYRGFQANRFLFAGFPKDAVWRRVEIEPHETGRLRYARYKDWVVFSGGTRKPSDLVANLSRGQVPIEDAKRFRAIQDAIVQGRRFPELIAAEGQDGELILIEGHSRATAYAACGFAENVKMFLASSPSMHGWVFY